MRRHIYVALTLVALAFGWEILPPPVPSIGDVLYALGRLWTEDALCVELATSLALNVEAIAWSTAITLGFAYASVIPAIRPLVAALSKLRFTGMVGWGFVLALAARDGHQLKVWMLVFGMTPFFVTAMASVVAEIPREQFDHARTLRLGHMRIWWEVVVRGTFDRMLETLRQNAAIGWMMLTMVEGVARSEGGVGTLLLGANKHLALDAVFALIVVVLVVGVVQDYVLGRVRRVLCPYVR